MSVTVGHGFSRSGFASARLTSISGAVAGELSSSRKQAECDGSSSPLSQRPRLPTLFTNARRDGRLDASKLNRNVDCPNPNAGAQKEEPSPMSTEDYTTPNWWIISRIYGTLVKLDGAQLRNQRLPDRHFRALVLAARNKPFGRRPRKDDSLRNALGNWLYSERYGAWRNPNRSRPYKENNRELWQEFVATTRDSSLRTAISSC